MSDRMMTLAEARDTIEVLEGFRAAHAAGLGHFETQTLTAAHTIVHQAEQIERLQNALQEVEEWGMNVLETLAYVGIIRPGDTEPPA